jgi:hypothetical protein
MKISIDTKEDTHEEIKKVIRMLSSLVGGEVMSNEGDAFSDANKDTNISSEGSPDQGSDLFNMFGADSGSSETKEDESSKIITEEEPKDKDTDTSKIEEYF